MTSKALKIFGTSLVCFEMLFISSCNNSSSTSSPVEDKTISVDFDTVGGTPVESQILEPGELVTEPTDVFKSGYVLDGWYCEGEEFDFDTPVYEDITLVANWVSDTSVVNFLCNGGSMDITFETYHYGDNVTLPVPNREGYLFLGWYYGDTLVTDGIWTILGNINLSASWAKEEITLTYLVEDNIIETQVVKYNMPYKLLDYEKDGFKVEFWSYENSQIPLSGEAWIYSLGDISLTPIWSEKTYSLIVDGIDEDKYSCPEEISVNINSNVLPKLPIPVVDESVDCGPFQGWYMNNQEVSDDEGNVFSNWFLNNSSTELHAVFGYPISNADELDAIRDNLDGFYVLTNDIDLGGQEWEPIGTISNSFSGCLFGLGHEVKNFRITTPKNYGGLFGVASSARFYNIRISNADYDFSGPLAQDVYCSGLCAYCIYSVFDGIIISDSIEYNIVSRNGEAYICGIAYSDTQVLFTNCINYSVFNDSDNTFYGIGVGTSFGEESDSRHNLVFLDCINYGAITAYSGYGIGCGDGFGRCINYGDINTVGVGYGIGSGRAFSCCINYGDVYAKECYGIGTSYNSQFWSCINYGNLVSIDSSYAIGYMELSYYDGSSQLFYLCANYGNITAGTSAFGIGSMDNEDDFKFGFYYCINYGDISASNGGNCIAIGDAFEFTECINVGNLTGKNVGFVMSNYENVISLKSVLNFSIINSKSSYGCLVAGDISDYDCFNSYYCCTIDKENKGARVNSSIGISKFEYQLTSNFLIEEMKLNTNIWNLTDVNFSSKKYPTLKGKPFDDAEILMSITDYRQVFALMENW